MKRSTNFSGSRATQHKKAMQPDSLLETFKFFGIKDEDAKKILEDVKAKVKDRRP